MAVYCKQELLDNLLHASTASARLQAPSPNASDSTPSSASAASLWHAAIAEVLWLELAPQNMVSRLGSMLLRVVSADERDMSSELGWEHERRMLLRKLSVLLRTLALWCSIAFVSSEENPEQLDMESRIAGMCGATGGDSTWGRRNERVRLMERAGTCFAGVAPTLAAVGLAGCASDMCGVSCRCKRPWCGKEADCFSVCGCDLCRARWAV